MLMFPSNLDRVFDFVPGSSKQALEFLNADLRNDVSCIIRRNKDLGYSAKDTIIRSLLNTKLVITPAQSVEKKFTAAIGYIAKTVSPYTFYNGIKELSGIFYDNPLYKTILAVGNALATYSGYTTALFEGSSDVSDIVLTPQKQIFVIDSWAIEGTASAYKEMHATVALHNLTPYICAYVGPTRGTGECRMKMAMREVKIIRDLHRKKIPHITPPYATTVYTPFYKTSSTPVLVLIQERLESTLEALIESRNVTVKDTLQIGRDISRAMAGLARENIVHVDIKPSNILVKRVNGIWRGFLHDFGSFKFNNQFITSGTYYFLAPEIEIGRGDVLDKATPSVDSYAFGVTLMECLTYGSTIDVDNEDLMYRRMTDKAIQAYIESWKEKYRQYRNLSAREKQIALTVFDICKSLLLRAPWERLARDFVYRSLTELV